MTTTAAATPQPGTPQPAPPVPPPRRRKRGRAVRISNVSWDEYEKLTEVFAERPALRMTYDDGELEIMVPSLGHDFSDRILATLVQILAEECGVPIRPGGSVTMKSKKKLKGIEGDDVFWLANANKLAGVTDLDLKIHPPPDLAVEVDVTHSSMDRLKIYARLGVPEVWRLDGDELNFYVLTGKKYQVATRSRAFPIVAGTDLVPVIGQARAAGDQTPVYRGFRVWLRQRLASAAPPAPPPPATP
jgi:Uma2 family endonuclease